MELPMFILVPAPASQTQRLSQRFLSFLLKPCFLFSFTLAPSSLFNCVAMSSIPCKNSDCRCIVESHRLSVSLIDCILTATSQPQLLKQTTKNAPLFCLAPPPSGTRQRRHLHHPRLNLRRRLRRHFSDQEREQRAQQDVPPGNFEPILLERDQSSVLVDRKIRVTDVGFYGKPGGSDVHPPRQPPRDRDCVGNGAVDDAGNDLGAGRVLVEQFQHSAGVLLHPRQLHVRILELKLVVEVHRVDLPGDEPLLRVQLGVQH
mmetsp:Transcript_34444/g.73362  ORF Transcript_34444/g.73362 Transcript_34444/m.73362 type:complete len:260 (+) Transcript_34444:82-861(+)